MRACKRHNGFAGVSSIECWHKSISLVASMRLAPPPFDHGGDLRRGTWIIGGTRRAELLQVERACGLYLSKGHLSISPTIEIAKYQLN
jgi:hypothetical protein